MFKHILLPTDGSPLSRRAVEAGISFAKEHGSRVTIYHAMDPSPRYIWDEGVALPKELIDRMEKQVQQKAEEFVTEAAKAAEAAGIEFDTAMDRPSSPHQGIIDAAKRNQCDAIFIGSHGRGGMANLLLGSVTRKVLSYANIPVTVYPNEITP